MKEYRLYLVAQAVSLWKRMEGSCVKGMGDSFISDFYFIVWRTVSFCEIRELPEDLCQKQKDLVDL